MKIVFLVMLYLSPIDGKTFSLMHPEHIQQKNQGELTLNGIVFLSDKDWVIWINYIRITPNKIPDWLKINSVTETHIKCEYLYNKLWSSVTLEPYDTFTPSLKTDTVK